MANLKYDVEGKPYVILKGKISAPKFQRNFVWKKKARKELINSIKLNKTLLKIFSLLFGSFFVIKQSITNSIKLSKKISKRMFLTKHTKV